MGEVVDLVQTHTSMANDMASNGIWKSESCSDAGLIHGGDIVDCLLGAACRHWCSAVVPVTMRSSQGARGSRGSWGSGGNRPTEEAGSECRIILEGLTKVLTNQDKLLTRKGGQVCQHSREGQVEGRVVAKA